MIIKNANSIDVPDYLNEQFFVNTLEEGLRETNITIHEINFEWGSNPGENYCSCIYRVRLSFDRLTAEPAAKTEELSLIVKTIPITEGTQFLEDVGVFIKEKMLYLDVLPRLEILANDDKFGAKCFYATKAPIQTIIFEDLKVEGFKIASRQDLLDWPHCELLLQQLARFHASSMVLAKRDPTIVGRLQKGMLCEETVLKSDSFADMFNNSLMHLIRFSKQWPDFEIITAKLQNYCNDFRRLTSQFSAPKPGDRFTVLNHGDLWSSNFMFAYNNAAKPNVPTRALFVDFQLSFYGSPGCDLNFFLNTCVQLDLLKTRRDDLIATYYKTFSEMLKYLHYEHVPTLEDLKYELRSREKYGLFALYGFLPIVSMPEDISQDSSIENLRDEEFNRKKFDAIYANEKLLPFLKYGLKRLDDLGVLDEF